MDKPIKKKNSVTATKKSSSNVMPKKKNSTQKTSENKNKKEGSKTKKKKVVQKQLPKKSNKKKIIILSVVITLSLLIIGATYYLINSPKFNISSIQIKGNFKISNEEILMKSGINIGDNIVKSIFKMNKKGIVDIPYISSAKINIKLPSIFEIEIHERLSIYFAYDKEKAVYYKLDKDGMILEVCDKIELKTDELLVYGITFDDEVILGSKINDIDYSKILTYNEIEKECLKVFPDRKINKVNFENSLTKIHLDDKLEVILPNSTKLSYNLNFLKEILKNEGDVKASIDMTKENPTLIKF